VIREKVLGEEHPYTATSYNKIGMVMQAMSDNVGVLEMLNKTPTISKKVFGNEYPKNATYFNNLGY
jgi:hypothetical protein